MPRAPKESDDYTPAETERRMADALRRALAGPVKRNAEFVKNPKEKKKKPRKAS